MKNLLGFLSMFLLMGCPSGSKNESTSLEETNLTDLKFTVEEAPEWTALFKRSSGWFGGDGIFAIPLNGVDNGLITDSSKNMILFSDTMLGEIEGGKLKDGSTMTHNTVAILNGSSPDSANIKFYWDTDEQAKPKTFFIPKSPSATAQDYYWLGDGFVNEATNNTYIFAYRMRNLDPKDDWSFRMMKQDIIAFPNGTMPPFKNHRQIETPLQYIGDSASDDGSFGAGIYVNTKHAQAPGPDGYIYVYGVKGREKELLVARVLPEQFEDFSQWKFYDGKDWNSDMHKAATLTTGVSNELSVSPLPDGRFVLVFQLNGMSNIVAMRIGASPIGPFGPVINLFSCPEQKENKKYTTYNAKAHPSLSKPGELLISYNVNAMDFWNQINQNPYLYRPRFIRIKFQ